MSSISTKKGDSGDTGTLGGERVPKYHIITEAVGTIDEANSLLGLARASAKEKRTRSIIITIQKHLFMIGAELSAANGKKKPKTVVSDVYIRWIEKLVEDFEDALVRGIRAREMLGADRCGAHTAVRKAERIAVKMKSDGLIENPELIKYLNRLSDLIFILACFEEKSSGERKKINRALVMSHLVDPAVRKVAISIGALMVALIVVVILLFIFHRPAPVSVTPSDHMQEMDSMHR